MTPGGTNWQVGCSEYRSKSTIAASVVLATPAICRSGRLKVGLKPNDPNIGSIACARSTLNIINRRDHRVFDRNQLRGSDLTHLKKINHAHALPRPRRISVSNWARPREWCSC